VAKSVDSICHDVELILLNQGTLQFKLVMFKGD
jgi:hypothetical protein